MDSLLIKKDPAGKDIVFVANSIRGAKGKSNRSILAWRPDSPNSEPFACSFDYYNSSKTLTGERANKIAEVYSKTFGVETKINQRLPRKLQAADIKSPAAFKRAVQALHDAETATPPTKPVEVTKEVPKSTVQVAYVLQRKGALWHLQDDAGNSIAYTVAEQDALRLMNELIGKSSTVH